MPTVSRTFRIFVSSTFSDLKAERNALQRHVFPMLRELCARHGCRFQAIDLRWGVSEEAALDQQAMNICLQELERCKKTTPRPNFILLLGDRYGWRPLPPQIPAEEFDEILKQVPKADQPLLQWTAGQTGKRIGWYRKDDNADPAEYCLRPREVAFPANAGDDEKESFRKSEAAEWACLESRMHSILLKAVGKLGWPAEDPRRVKYEASATHQEILAGALSPTGKDARKHVFGFLREIANLDALERDLDKPQPDPDLEAFNFIDCHRDESGKIIPDHEALGRLKLLKEQELKPNLAGNILPYEATWTGSGITADHVGALPDTLDACLKLNDAGDAPAGLLCVDVWRRLSTVILKEVAELEDADPLDQEIRDHQAFADERLKFFTGRTGVLAKIRHYTGEQSPHLLTICGESGSGKTALMAQAASDAAKQYPDAVVIFRFIGATPASSDIRSLLKGLCEQIYRRCGFEEQKRARLSKLEGGGEEVQKERRGIEEDYAIPDDMQKLPETFRKFLSKVPEEGMLILFLDALDQFSDADSARSLDWLPMELPERVRLIVSTLPGECLKALESRLPESHRVELEKMPVDEGQSVLAKWLKAAGRTLQAPQLTDVLDRFRDCGLPLYLKLAFEEARLWKSYALSVQLSPDIPGMLRDLFARLSAETNHGKLLVSRSLGYLAAAKNGLTEDELLDVLSLDDAVMDDFIGHAYHKPPERRLPVVVWSRLYFDLKRYLAERSADGTSLLSFYHRQLAETAAECYLVGTERRDRHRSLAGYFTAKPLWIEHEGKQNPNIRKVSELPYQQTHGAAWDGLEETLTDLRFVEAKCAADMTYDLVRDYGAALEALPEVQEDVEEDIQRQVRINCWTQEIIEYARRWSERRDRCKASRGASLASESFNIPFPEVIRSIPPCECRLTVLDHHTATKVPSRLERLRQFSGFVRSESHNFLRYAHHPAFCIKVACNSDSELVSRQALEALRNEQRALFLLRCDRSNASRHRGTPMLQVMTQGIDSLIGGVHLSSDSRICVTAEKSRLRVWDLAAGACSAVLTGEGGVNHWGVVAITPDVRRAVSSSSEVLHLWDLAASIRVRTLAGHERDIRGVDITPDGRRAVTASRDMSLRVWDLQEGQCERVLKGHADEVKDVKMTPDGRHAVSGSVDKTVRLWDIDTGSCLLVLSGHTNHVNAVAISADGRVAVSGSGDPRWNSGTDNSVRVWDLARGECLHVCEGHSNHVNAVSITADGRLAISGSSDRTLRVWDLMSGQCIRTLEGHSGAVLAVDLSPDGRWGVSGGFDASLRLWDLAADDEFRDEMRQIPAHYFRNIETTTDGRLAATPHGRVFHVWDGATGRLLHTLEGNEDGIEVMTTTPDGLRLITGGGHPMCTADYLLRVWSIKEGMLEFKLGGHTNTVKVLAVTPDGSRLVSGTGGPFNNKENALRVWDLRKAIGLGILEGHTKGITAVALTVDGCCLVSGSDDADLRVWSVEKHTCSHILRGHRYRIKSLALTPDGRIALSGAGDEAVRAWNLGSGVCVSEWQEHPAGDWSEGFISLITTPDGGEIVSAWMDGRIRVYSLKDKATVRVFEGHSGDLTDVRITPDGKYAISASSDKTIRVWDMEAGHCLCILPENGAVFGLSAIRPDGKLMASVEGKGIVGIEIRGGLLGPPIVTAVRIRLYSLNSNENTWDKTLTTLCPWCGKRSHVDRRVIDAVTCIARDNSLSPDESPCISLSPAARHERHLLSVCSSCHNPLKFNPFVVDESKRP